MTAIVPASDANVKRAAAILRAGGLVSFPTETVYGLGAHGLDEHAVLAIFTAKGRPLTDPLILHVHSLEAALPLTALTPRLEVLVRALAARFWPGPLTLVLPASAHVPLKVRAGGPTVGLRVPAHPVALALLKEADVPVAAPSANRFGHVSPTRAEHVASDLPETPGLTILDGGACPVGIESTIVKVEEASATVLRRGSVTLLELRETLAPWLPAAAVTAVTRTLSAAQGARAAQDAPGQLLTHYAPDVPAFLANPDVDVGTLDTTAIIDVGGRLGALQGGALAYRDLSDESALHGAFDALRWAEALPGVRRILLPDLSGLDDERLLALADRFFRSASGRSLG